MGYQLVSHKINLDQQPENPTMLTVSDYRRLAKQAIRIYGEGFAKAMLKNEDAISFVMEYLMNVHLKFNADPAWSTKYLSQHFRIGVLRWKQKYARASSQPPFTTSIETLGMDILYKVSKHISPSNPKDLVINEEIIDLFNSPEAPLTKSQKETFDMLVQGLTIKQIADKKDIREESVLDQIRRIERRVQEVRGSYE
jgi:hypothetical protein